LRLGVLAFQLLRAVESRGLTAVHLPVVTGASLATILVAMALVRSSFLRGRLIFAFVLALASAGLELADARGLGDRDVVAGLARLLLVAAGIVTTLSLLVNPWRQNRASDRVPAIVQDVSIIGLFAVAATLLLDEKVMTTSAVGAVVVGFALQDTLGNLFSGLAIQIEKPFRVGQWIRIGDHEGQVQELTWRATKLLTKAGQFAILPNSLISKEPILNYSEPTVPTRLELEVGATYEVAPNEVKRALAEAVDSAPLVLRHPSPDIIVADFGSSAIAYRIRFWIEDYARDAAALDQVRTNIWYAFKRHGVEIPFPIQVEYQRDEKPPRTPEHVSAVAAQLQGVDLFTALDDEERVQLVWACSERLYASGERIVRQGDAGQSMFLVLRGQVRVTLEPSGQEVAVTSAGGFFGEMSMLTGDPRTATVSARGDAALLEIDAERFRALAVRCPGLVEHVSAIVSTRRAGLAEAQAAADEQRANANPQQSLLSRIKVFLKL
jgi:small-conductance mechanosensitive channel